MQNPNHSLIKGGFRKRALPLSADYRPMYKIGQLILVLQMVSRGGKSSLNRLHFFIWALKSSRNMEFIKSVVESNNKNDIVSWGVEPALNKALLFGVAENLFELHDDKYTLTAKGKSFAKNIQSDKDLFIIEKEFLGFIGKQTVTEGFITELTSKMTN